LESSSVIRGRPMPEERLDRIEVKIDRLTLRVDGLQEKLTGRVDGLDERLTSRIDGLGENLTSRADGHDAQLHKLTILHEDTRDNLRRIADGVAATNERFERVELSLDEIKSTMDLFVRTQS